MNINTKAILASTLLTALIAGTSAFAEDAGFDLFENFNAVTSESVVAQKVSLQTPSVKVKVNR